MRRISKVFRLKSSSEVLLSLKSPFHVGTSKNMRRQFIFSSSAPLAEVP